jgi:YesN/AraC family two-component response regulator
MPAPGRILIVDDDPGLLDSLQTALVPPHRVFTCRNGLDAFAIVQEQDPDLVLLDYILPDVSGLMVLRALKQAYPSIPVILMTAFGSEEIAIEAFRGGVRDYLKKPIRLSDLRSRVENLLAARRQTDGVASHAPWRINPPVSKSEVMRHEANLRRATVFIETHLHTELRLDQVAREAGMSKFRFCRRFKDDTGLTFREFLARRRIARAVELLRDQTRSVSEVYLDVGFKDASHFSRVFLKVTGQSPSRFRRTTHELH